MQTLQQIVENCDSFRQVIVQLGSAPNGERIKKLKKRMVNEGIDFSHFTKKTGITPGKCIKRKPEDILLKRDKGNRATPRILRRALIESGVEYKCVDCGNDGFWNGKKLNLEINHIDGDSCNDSKDNLEFVCPNCHNQKTYKPIKIPKIKHTP